MLVQLLFMLLIHSCLSDIYLHNPRGSNNRLNERSANRANANRLFDSQNNNRGGYNVGDRTDRPAASNASSQYPMEFFQSEARGKSLLTFEWTNQHGCGGHEGSDPHKQNCMLVLQYACKDEATPSLDQLRDGTSTRTASFTGGRRTETAAQRAARRSADVTRGQHESWEHYDACYRRQRNMGLFTADQKLKQNGILGYSSAIYTRQNSNGNRYGYECPEERDYYPYWHPSLWRDVAILTDMPELCNWLQEESNNVVARHECVPNTGLRTVALRWNTESDCLANGGLWVAFHSYLEKTTDTETACLARGYKWAVPHDAVDVNQKQCLVPLSKPDCRQAPWSRSNHLGNGRDAVPLNYTWQLPYFPSGKTKRCVARLRYNISTDDYDPYRTNSSFNQNSAQNYYSPVQNNPLVDVGGTTPLRLAINTAQTGRVFQDRTHVFLLKPRPQGFDSRTLYNLNVRGKRGNIVQTYPSVEYDFVPQRLTLRSSDLVHIQWTGSNTHNNGAPAGDGQQGDDGNGRAGTDRNNLLEIGDSNYNFPLVQSQMRLVRHATVHWSAADVASGLKRKWSDVALELATSSYYKCAREVDCPWHAGDCADSPGKAALNELLDNAPASFPGVVLSFAPGEYAFMCSRNNDFSNRSHKGKLIVV